METGRWNEGRGERQGGGEREVNEQGRREREPGREVERQGEGETGAAVLN